MAKGWRPSKEDRAAVERIVKLARPGETVDQFLRSAFLTWFGRKGYGEVHCLADAERVAKRCRQVHSREFLGD